MVLGNTYDIKTGEWRSDANSLLSVQELWFAVFMTVLYVAYPDIDSSVVRGDAGTNQTIPRSILIPWVTLREVPVEVEIVSPPSRVKNLMDR